MLYYAIWHSIDHMWMTLSGPFEYVGWVEEERGRDAARLPAWKAYQIINHLGIEALQAVPSQ